jgi:hypothetical protein
MHDPSRLLASAAHHGWGAPSGRRMPTEASERETLLNRWSREAASAPGGARGEPRSGEGAPPPGAGCGAEPRLACVRPDPAAPATFGSRAGAFSFLDTYEVTRPERPKCPRAPA